MRGGDAPKLRSARNARLASRPVVERDWEHDLADIVGRIDTPPASTTVDLRDAPTTATAAAPSSEELAAWVERLGASLLRLVDRRMVDLGHDVGAELASLDARVDVLIDVVEALAAEVAAISRAVGSR